MPKSQKLSREEIQQQLFDALMEQIEPKLVTNARKETAAELAAMEPEQRAEWMLYFQKAYEEFVDRWPEFVANATKQVGAMGTELQQMSGESDAMEMKNIEESFDNDDTSASAA